MSRSSLVFATASLIGLLALSACATSEKIQAKQLGDADMTCDQIVAENAKLDAAVAEIESNKGVTGTNVAAALFWLPGLAYTYYDAGQAEELILQRRAWLVELHDQKNCGKTPA